MLVSRRVSLMIVVFLQIYVCGAGRIAAGVKEAIIQFIKEQKKTDDASALAHFEKIMNGRYATDIFE